jgi:hypothetical protein
MRRIGLFLFLGVPLFAQWTVWDPTNYGLNLKNLAQGVQDYQKAVEYYTMARQAAAFVNNPAAFMASAAVITNMALRDSVTQGWTTKQRQQQIQAKMQMGQVLMSESQSIGALSHGNASSIGQIATSMQGTAEELARLNKKLADEERTNYYQSKPYVPQSATIAAWRLK